MTNNAPLPFDASLPSCNSGIRKPLPDVGVEGLAVWHLGRLLLHQEEAKLAMRPDAVPQLTQLPGDHRLLLQKEEEELAIGPYLLGTSHSLEVVRKHVLSQASRKGQRTSSHNSSIRPDTPDRMPWLPCFHKALSQLQY